MVPPEIAAGSCPDGFFDRYGMRWQNGTTEVAIHLACFREKMAGRVPWSLGKIQPPHHFKAIAVTLWPEKSETPPNFIWHSWAWLMLCRACKEKYLAIAGSGGAGKSEFIAIWCIIQFLCDPANTLCVVTSTTVAISRKKIWGAIVKYWTPVEKIGMPGKLVDSLSIIRYVNETGKSPNGDKVGITLVTGEKKQGKENVGKIIGIHPPRLVFCADELSELSEAITEAFYTNLSKGNEYAQLIGISNPASYFDPFGKFAEPKAGWESITVEDDEWETHRGVCIHLDAMKNPRIMEGDERCVWMDTQEVIDREIAIHGGQSAMFWRMIRGFWCPTGMIEQVYSEVEILGYEADQKEKAWYGTPKTTLAFLDPGFTNGGDRSVATFGVIGDNAKSQKVLEYQDQVVFHDNVTNKTKDHSQQLALWYREQCESRGVKPEHAGYDSTGGGGPFGEILAMLWSPKTVGVYFGGKASEKPVSAFDPTLCCDRYFNRVTEIWYSAKEPMRTGQIKGLPPEVIKQLSMRKKIDDKGNSVNPRLKVMPKTEMKLRTSRSPDEADSAMGLCELARMVFGFSSASAMRSKLRESGIKLPSYKNIFKKFDIFAGRAA